MKIKTYNATNSKSSKTGAAYVRFHGKSGVTTISGAAAERFGLKVGSYIQFVQDEESPKDWYLTNSTETDGFQLRPMKESTNLTFNCSKLAQDVIASCHVKDVSMRCNVGVKTTIDNVDYLPIITAIATTAYDNL